VKASKSAKRVISKIRSAMGKPNGVIDGWAFDWHFWLQETSSHRHRDRKYACRSKRIP